MIRVNDHIGRSIQLPSPPNRVVSLCPSITETLFALGLKEKIVGRTRFCIHPAEEVASAVRVGGTKAIKMDRLHALKPDLIIAEKEENTPEMVRELEKHYPVFVVNVEEVSHAYRMVEDLGRITQTESQATDMLSRIKRDWQQIFPLTNPLSTVYLIWQDPIMAVGRDTYIQSVLAHCGLTNLCLEIAGRYPTLSASTLKALSPELLLLSSEPFPFTEIHIQTFQELLPHTHVQLVDGEMFSWYGSHMLAAGPYLQDWLQSLETVSTSAK